MEPLMSPPHRHHPIRTEEDVGALRRAVAALAAGLPGLPDGDAELVASELGTNILRHTTGGYVLYRTTGDGIELIAVDHGPGSPADALPSMAEPLLDSMASPPRESGDGLGVGLAVVRGRASTFDYCSTPRGTVVLARLHLAQPTATGQWHWGGVNVPLGGTGESGDGWAIAPNQCLAAVVVDGLGHGPQAAAAASAAITVFDEITASDHQDPTASTDEHPASTQLADFTRQAHQAMRGTRGGVVGICLIDPQSGQLTYSGVGNIAGRILTGSRNQHLVSHPGTLGTSLVSPRTHVAAYPWQPGAMLVLTTDGIDTHWDPACNGELLRHHPVVIAATIHRDHARGTDDATVLVVRDTRGPVGYW
jgi:anti-sigma regulatory factor (Ser/Thr protein kinase)/serine/threonine protein phosphatase PrpC